MSGRFFLGLTNTKQRIKCLAQWHNTVPPMRLEPATLWSWSSAQPVKISTAWITICKNLYRSRVDFGAFSLPQAKADYTGQFVMLHFVNWTQYKITITNCRQNDGTARKSHTTITEQQDKLSKTKPEKAGSQLATKIHNSNATFPSADSNNMNPEQIAPEFGLYGLEYSQ